MLIDWFTVAAQVVNFLVLVLLLRRFLYRPVMHAMAERRRRIDEQLAEAEGMRVEAAAQQARLQQEAERLAVEREARAQRLREELDAARRHQLQQARADIEDLSARWRAAVEREKEAFLAELRRRSGEQLVEAVRRALRDLADASLEARVVDQFLARLDELDAAQRAALVDAARRNGTHLHMRTAFPLSPALRDRLAAAVERTIGPEYDLRFEVTPALVGGVELRAGGQALGWTFDDYLESLEAALADAFGAQQWEQVPGA
jgi:F-type H+-transporting ATPase subunit b